MIVGIVKIGAALTALEEFRNATDEATAVGEFCNEYTPSLNQSDYLGVDGGSVDRSKLWGWDFSEGTPALKEITYILNTPAPVDLETYKNDIIKDVIEKRNHRLNNHFVLAEYPASSGKMFDCSIEAQDHLNKLKSLFDLGHITGNFQLSTYDRRDSYVIVDMTDLSGLIASVSGVVLSERSTAEGYVSAVIAAANEAAAIISAKPYLDL